ncbi:class I SAM-dependent methyltransferase [Patescibacteria group bacterium]|nr:class I SAM-dependent methyltransferase [Patescibacteria group bacterium]MBU1500276.1 class I SAM-dependent methyltransferase [Patescibacteria group bacterium]
MKSSTLRVIEDPKTHFIHLDPIPDKKTLAQYYENYHHQLKEDFNPTREKQRLKAIRKFVSSGRLLDIGAGRGFFVKTALKAGFQAEGVEISQHACCYAQKKFKLKLHQGAFLDLKLTLGVYDVITLHSTLEHFPQPSQVLKKALTLLKPGGLLVFSVPNLDCFEYFLSQHTPYPYTGFILEHLYYFNHSLVKKLLTDFQLKPLLITSRHYSPIEPLRLSPMLIGNLAKRILEATDWGGRLGWGNVLYVYAQKNN